MAIAPLIVLGVVTLTLRWLLAKAKVTAADVSDEAKGPSAGAHLPSIHPDVRDVVTPRSMEVDADTQRMRNIGPWG